jgi:hypothetical protein
MSPEEIRQEKEVEFYSAGLTAWYNTSLEHDKSVFGLSAGGIGLLITLLTTVGVSSVSLLGVYIVAIVCFLVSLGVVLAIFWRNRVHIERTFSGTAPSSDPWLERLDLTAIFAFGAGVVFAAVVGVSAAVNSLIDKKEKAMASETKTNSSTRSTVGDSFNKLQNLRPGVDLGRSFNGVGNLQPQPTPSTPAPAPVVSIPAAAPALPQPTESTNE